MSSEKETGGPRSWRQATQLVRGGTRRTAFAETSEALFLNSGFVYETAEEAEQAFAQDGKRFVYSRFGNPTVAMLEERLALLEGAKFGRVTATGMAAIFATIMASIDGNSRVVAAKALFGSSIHIMNEILPKFGVETQLVDGADLDQWRAALAPGAACVLVETPSNPCCDLIDLPALAALSHAAGAKLIVDNVFATPILQRPLELGADVVVYSATKHMDGHGRVLGGAILTDDDAWLGEQLVPFLRNTGPGLSPFNAWVILKGLESLDIRVRRHSENALQLAQFLEGHGGIARVCYPFLESHPQYDLARAQMAAGGPMMAFDVAGGKAGAFAFLNALALIDISNNLGDAKSLVTHPATTTHHKISAAARAEVGIGPGTIRFSVGLEDPLDLQADLAQALARVPAA